jgi:hypothetical protein
MVRKPKLVAFTPEIGRRVKKNAGGTLTSIINFDTKPRRNSGGGVTLYRYATTSNFGTSSPPNSAEATADIFTLSGSSQATGVTLYCPLGLAMWQTTGGKGLCVFDDGEYYVVVPECEPDEVPP